jgi:hypothetical protein
VAVRSQYLLGRCGAHVGSSATALVVVLLALFNFFYFLFDLLALAWTTRSGILAVRRSGGEEGVEQVVLLIGLVAGPVSRPMHARQGLLSRHPERLQATAGDEPCPSPQRTSSVYIR